MAQVLVSAVNPTTVSWSISGLSSPFNTTYYLDAVLSTSPIVDGSASAPSGILNVINAPSSGSNTFTPTSQTTGGGAFSGGSTYTLYGTMHSANGLYYTAGSATVTMPSTRPSNYHWTYAGLDPNTNAVVTGSSKISGYGFYMSYIELANLQSTVNSFRSYKSLGTYSFTTPTSGGLFYASLFNEVVNAISPMNPPTPVPTTVSSGQSISAAMLNGLINSLNSIT